MMKLDILMKFLGKKSESLYPKKRKAPHSRG